MAGRTKEEAEATRVQIIDAAEHVFYAKGVSGASLAEVAQAAGVTRGAIYWHFENKVDLFNAMLDRIRLPLDEISRSSEDENEPDPLGCLRDLLLQVLRRVALDASVQRTVDILRLKCEYTGELQGLRERLKVLGIECDQRLAKALGNAVNKGQLPADLDCLRAATYLHAFIVGVESNWLMMENFDLAEQAAQVVDSSLDMLRYSPALRIKVEA